MEQNQQFVTIKGTKDGLTLHLNDTCSYEELLNEIEEKLSINHYEMNGQSLISVHLKIGNRFLTKTQEQEICNLIKNKKNLIVDSIDCEVVSIKQAIEWKRNNEIFSVAKIIRSGQTLEIKGDLLLIGDVNPGATVRATGNIFIMGSLRGIAHAGSGGNKNAIIASSLMKPMQLRISDVVSRSPDYMQNDNVQEVECAYVNEENKIVVDRIQLLTHIRPNLTRLERRM